MKKYFKTININTSEKIQFIDITNKIKNIVDESGIADGIVNISTTHTTTSIKVNERCERLQKDMLEMLEKLAPLDKKYLHNESTVDGRENAHSHLMSFALASSETIPLINKKIQLGSWQSIFFIELDGVRNNRNVNVMIIGE